MYVPARDFAGMKVLVLPDADDCLRGDCRRSSRMRSRPAQSSRGRAVLGLATGSTPEKVYAHLVEWHRSRLALVSKCHDLQPRRILSDQPA